MSYTGTLIDSLIELVDFRMKRSGDPILDLAEVKTKLADRVPMTQADIHAWEVADELQKRIATEATRKDPTKKLIRVRMDKGGDRWVLLDDLEMKIGPDGYAHMQCSFGQVTEKLV